MNNVEKPNLDNSSCIEVLKRQKTGLRGKKVTVYDSQISIENLLSNKKVSDIKVSDIEIRKIDELNNLNLEKIEKSYTSPVEEAWLHPTNIVDVSLDNINSARENIKSLKKKGLIDLDIDSINNDELVSQLVCFQSGTSFHSFKYGSVILNGNILVIPIKTSKIYDQGSRNFMYVGNIDIKDMFRKSKTSNTYNLPSGTKESYFHSIKIGQKIHVIDYQAIKVIKANPDYDRSLIRSR